MSTEPEPKDKKPKRGKLGCLVVLLLLPVILLAGLLTALQLPPVQDIIAGFAGRAASDFLGYTVSIDGLRGFLPMNLRVASVRLADDEGTFVTIEDTTLAWSPTSVIGGKVHVNSFQIANVDLPRLPVTADDQPADDTPFQIPTLPSPPTWLTVDDMAITKIILGEGVVPEGAELAAQGSIVKALDVWTTNLSVTRDGQASPLLTLALQDKNGLPLIDFKLRDEALIPELAGLSAPVTADLSGSGPAANWVLEGSVEAGGTNIATLTAVNNLTEGTVSDGTLRTQFAGLNLPEAVAEYLGSGASAAWKLKLSPKGALDLDQFNVSGEGWDLALSGQVGLQDDSLDLDVELNYRREEVLATVLTDLTPENVSLYGRITGTLAEPNAALTLKSDDDILLATNVLLGRGTAIRVAGDLTLTPPAALLPERAQSLAGQKIAVQADVTYAAEALTIDRLDVDGAGIDLKASGTLDTENKQADLQATFAIADLTPLAAIADLDAAGAIAGKVSIANDGAATRITLDASVSDGRHDTVQVSRVQLTGNAAQPGWPDTWPTNMPVDLNLTVTGLKQGDQVIGEVTAKAKGVLASAERIEIDAASVTAPGLSATASGTVSPQSLGGDLQGNLNITDLGPAAKLAGLDAAGQGDFNFTVSQGDATTFSIKGEATQLAGLPEAANGLVGSQFQLDTTGTLADQLLTITSLRLVTANAEVDATGTYGLEDQAVSGTGHVIVPNLTPLSDLAGRKLAGRLEADAEVSGALPQATLILTANGTDVLTEPVLLPAVILNANLNGLPEAPQGTFDLDLKDGSRSLNARGELRMEGEILTLAPLTLAAGKNTLNAETRINLTTTTAKGSVKLAFSDLAYLGNLLSYPLTGSATLNATFNTDPAAGFVKASGDINNLKVATTTLAKAELTADMKGAPSALNGRVALNASQLGTDSVQAETLAFELNGDQRDATYTLSMSGKAMDQQPLSIESEGSLALTDGRATLRTLDMMLADVPILLQDSTTLTWGKNGFQLEPMLVHVSDGTIQLAGSLQGNNLNVTGEWSEIPVRLAELAGYPRYEGMIAGDLNIQGAISAPQGEINLQAQGIRAPDSPKDLRMDVTSQVLLSPQQVTTTTDVAIADAGNLRLAAVVPLAASGIDSPPGLPENVPVNGSLTGKIDLAKVESVLAIQGHEMAGTLNADLRFDGPLRQLLFDGMVTLSQGFYENKEYGTRLAGVSASLEAQGKHLRIVEFTANDGIGGTIDASGQILLSPEDAMPFDFATELKKMRVVYRDDMDATVAGTLSVGGNLNEMNVKGDLTLVPVNYILPDRLPPSSLEELQVVEINGPQSGVEMDEAAEDAPLQIVNLDVKVSAPRRVNVTGPVLDSEWQGDLHITGTAAKPVIAGNLRVARGYLDLLGRRFDLENSSIAFDGGESIDPYLDWTARSKTSNMEGLLHISGTMNKLTFELSSQPAYPEDEIIAQLLFDRSLDEITPLQAIQLARVAAMLSGSTGGRSLFSEGFAGNAVDRFDIRSGENPGEAVVSVGKYLTEDIYAEIEQGAGTESSKVKVNIEFSPRFSGEAEVGSKGTRAGIFYKKDY